MKHRTRHMQWMGSTAALLLLAGCNHSQLLPDWKPKLPTAWQEQRVPQAAPEPAQNSVLNPLWWTLWKDPALDQVMALALKQNLALQQVAERVEKARALRAEVEASLMPQFGVGADAKRADQGLLTRGKPESIADASVQMAWELDLFGKLRAARTAAQADERANAASLRAAKLLLQAEVVKAYIELRHAQAQTALLQGMLANQTEQVGLLQVRQEGGLDDGMATRQARSVLLEMQAQLPTWQAAERAAMNRLNLLAGVKVGTLDAQLTPPKGDGVVQAGLPTIPPSVVLAGPARVLANRPDIAEAEAKLAMAKAFQDVAVANQYPSLTLSSLFGLQYTSSMDTNKLWSVGAGVAAPLFTFGKMQAQIDQADADARAAFAGYKAQILIALEETETALSRYCYGLQQVHEREQALANAEELRSLAETRYRGGISTYLEVLDAHTRYQQAQQGLAQARADAAMQLMRVYQALGNG